MKKIFLILLFCFGCASQPFVIQDSSPRIIVKDIQTGEEMKTREEFFEAVYPDPTKGYIENRAYPYIPKVWIIENKRKIILIGPREGVPQFWQGEIREFNFPPGRYILHIERWRRLPRVYGGWKKQKKTEIVKLKVAQFEKQFSENDHYGWRIIINPTSTSVY